MDLFLGGLTFGGAYYWREICVSKWLWIKNKTKQKENQPKNTEETTFKLLQKLAATVPGPILEGLLSENFMCKRLEGLIFGIFW